VLNDTKVLPVRLTGHKRPGGGLLDLVLLAETGENRWEALIKGRVRIGTVIELDGGEALATVIEQHEDGGVVLQFDTREPLRDLLSRIGQMPLPPYIKRDPTDADRTWYQTIFARAAGAVAAPTAGLHFTEALVDALKRQGIVLVSVTLHVGPGTFRPVRADRVEEHRMSPESFEVPADTVAAVAAAKTRGSRVIAVGTTVARTLETVAERGGRIVGGQGRTDLFIMPGYRFRVIDGLMTNFHLPKTTLLMLVSAFAGHERLRAAYEEAVRLRYRFYSYGDAMLIV
jgi:S-adenosylmethionine:tRNA ribosyltransferase-isomerase